MKANKYCKSAGDNIFCFFASYIKKAKNLSSIHEIDI